MMHSFRTRSACAAARISTAPARRPHIEDLDTDAHHPQRPPLILRSSRLMPERFMWHLKQRGVNFFTGVPDNTLQDLVGYMEDTEPASRHVVAANEGAAVAIASGYHLGTGKIPAVYLQNSGIGNAVNPLLSLCSSGVYSIPMLLLVGWRGEPGTTDEPQHAIQGEIMPGLLSELRVPWAVLPSSHGEAEPALDSAIAAMQREQQPFVMLVRQEAFQKYKPKAQHSSKLPMSREAAVQLIIEQLNGHEIIVSGTGMVSRELFEYRQSLGAGHQRDFLTVGSMGHASAIALGIANARPDRKVVYLDTCLYTCLYRCLHTCLYTCLCMCILYTCLCTCLYTCLCTCVYTQVVCLDGDGSALMHLGNVSTIGAMAPPNLVHIVLNNGAHDSAGGSYTAGFQSDFAALAKAAGYRSAQMAKTEQGVVECLRAVEHGPSLIEIQINRDRRADLGRPTITPSQNKIEFMSWIDNSTVTTRPQR